MNQQQLSFFGMILGEPFVVLCQTLPATQVKLWHQLKPQESQVQALQERKPLTESLVIQPMLCKDNGKHV